MHAHVLGGRYLKSCLLTLRRQSCQNLGIKKKKVLNDQTEKIWSNI